MKKNILPIILILSMACQTPVKTMRPPNIIFVFADDLTYTAVNALGNKDIQTPHLDRLVQEGTTFTHTYNMGAWNGAVCVASRAMMISGRNIWDANNFRQKWLKDLDIDKTWGKLMETQGYDTYMSGKWHVDADAKRVFQKTIHIRPGMPSDNWKHEQMSEKLKAIHEMGVKPSEIMPIGYNRPIDENDTSWSPTDPKFKGYWEGGKHWSEVLKDDALNFIEEAKEKTSPFFMYLAFNAPHDPRQAPQEYLDKYPLEAINLPKSWQPFYPYKDSIGNSLNLRDEALAPFPRTPYAIKKHLQEYYALISHMDHQIGLILDALEKSGKKDNTYLIFTADHGLAMGRHGLLGKQNLYDHSIRVPFMIIGPDIPKGKRISEAIYLQDAMATSLELAGAEKPDYIAFNSFIDLLRGTRNTSFYPEIYGCYINLQRMIIKDDYKLIVYPKLKKVRLFNTKEDPEELNDLASNPEYQEKIKTLFNALIRLQDQMNDPLDLKTLYPNL